MPVMPVDTHYARSGDLRIAYQVVGDGPIDLVFVPGFISNLELYWEEPTLAHFLSRLGSFSRLILFDKRGHRPLGPDRQPPTLEERMDDVRAVMDAVGSEHAALFGISEGGAMSMLFAATYPERTQALSCTALTPISPTWVLPPERFEPSSRGSTGHWGTGESLKAFAPSKVADERFKQWWARFERLGASPSALHRAHAHEQPDRRAPHPRRRSACRRSSCIARTTRASTSRRALPRAPTSRREIRRAARHPITVLWAGDVDALADEIEEFLTGTRAEIEPDRVLATVLFTDIVDSTKRARRWAIGDGAICSTSTTRSSAGRSSGFAGGRSRRSATVFWRPSTVRPAQCGARSAIIRCRAVARSGGPQRRPYRRDRDEG